ncbi:MAG: hypothetical protein FJY19_02700 [Bacteroidetes bacterium]|nr:hypothetical protein [Bacteroidota bacterium]
MQKLITIFFLFILGTACQQKEKSSPTASSEIDAARNFLRAALDGKFDIAKDYLLQDSLNLSYLDIAARGHGKLTQDDKDSYRGSSIIIHEIQAQNDSTSLLIFSNSFKKDQDTLRIIKKDQKWVVDLSYLYLHPTSSNNP